MNSSGALRRSWKPVARMVVWQLQGSVVQAPVRGFTTTVTSVDHFLPSGVIEKGLFFGGPGSRSGSSIAWRSSSMASCQVRFASSKSGAAAKDEDEAEEETLKEGLNSEHPAVRKAAREMVRSNYWGVTTPTFTREDGTKWPWHCFRPGDTYETDHNIDLDKHHIPQNFEEKVAYNFVKLLRIPVDLFFMKRYGCRAMMLETVAAVPGMVGGMLLHLRSLRRFEQSGGWIKALLDEAENERMHLMTLLEVVKPSWYERLLVVAVQGIFFNAYFIFYLLSPRMAHRFTGYLEEEAIWSYTHFLKNIDNGNVENIPAPTIAIDYWRLPKDARLRDVIIALRADEAHHRDVNHYASDIRMEGKQLSESPAPVDYH